MLKYNGPERSNPRSDWVPKPTPLQWVALGMILGASLMAIFLGLVA